MRNDWRLAGLQPRLPNPANGVVAMPISPSFSMACFSVTALTTGTLNTSRFLMMVASPIHRAEPSISRTR